MFASRDLFNTPTTTGYMGYTDIATLGVDLSTAGDYTVTYEHLVISLSSGLQAYNLTDGSLSTAYNGFDKLFNLQSDGSFVVGLVSTIWGYKAAVRDTSGNTFITPNAVAQYQFPTLTNGNIYYIGTDQYLYKYNIDTSVTTSTGHYFFIPTNWQNSIRIHVLEGTDYIIIVSNNGVWRYNTVTGSMRWVLEFASQLPSRLLCAFDINTMKLYVSRWTSGLYYVLDMSIDSGVPGDYLIETVYEYKNTVPVGGIKEYGIDIQVHNDVLIVGCSVNLIAEESYIKMFAARDQYQGYELGLCARSPYGIYIYPHYNAIRSGYWPIHYYDTNTGTGFFKIVKLDIRATTI